jgi:O-antigen/teichoic acid export membrane protein
LKRNPATHESEQQTGLPLHRRVVQLFYGKLASASAWLFVGGIVGGLLGYVFQVLMGRMLSTQEYGLFNAMMAFFIVLGAPLGTLMMVVSRKISEYRARLDGGSGLILALLGYGLLWHSFKKA